MRTASMSIKKGGITDRKDLTRNAIDSLGDSGISAF